MVPINVAEKLHSDEEDNQVLQSFQEKKFTVVDGRRMTLDVFIKAVESYYRQDDIEDIVEMILKSIQKVF